MWRSKFLPRLPYQLVMVFCLLLTLVIPGAGGVTTANAQTEQATPAASGPPASHQFYLPLLQNGGSDTLQSNATLSIAQDPLALQITALQDEKANRTPEERKLDSRLLFLSRESTGRLAVAGAPNLRSRIQRDADGRVKVEIAAAPSAELRQAISAAGGTIIYESTRWQWVTASVPPAALIGLAARADVKQIKQAAEFTTHTGPINNEADPAHRAGYARATYGLNGSGITVGVISDSDDHAEGSIANGELPSNFTTLPGKSGRPAAGEGTAMSEIVYDIAPGAKILFASAAGGPASFADSILALRAAGAQIIVDDISYGEEWQFQDDVIAQAVNEVVADGALYFSSAGNEGNLRNNNATVWEGDFVNGGANALLPGGTVQRFGAQPYNGVAEDNSTVELQWSDEYNSAANDYDLYVLSADGTAVVASSTNVQDGNDVPLETVDTVNTGERIVIFKATSAAPRYLRLLSHGGVLTIGTPGEIIGHASTGNSIAVAASSAAVAVQAPPGYFTTTSQAETYSSDGPRKMFYKPDGTPFTVGNFLASGGLTLKQPILTAGDCGATSVPDPGFQPFCGTSAAAPTAAAIAALTWSSNLNRTNTQVRAILEQSLLDIQDPGFDINTGKGILMADLALANAVGPTPTGTIIIRKTTSPIGGAGFGFTSNIPGATSFTLNHGQSKTVNNVAAGAYTVSENNPSGYSLTNLVCMDPSGGTSVNIGARMATINLAAGETVDCTFTNTQSSATPTVVISSDSNGSVPGLSFRDEDIMAYNPNTRQWALVFDGSDVGLGNVDVDGFAFLANGQLLLSVDKDFTLSGFGAVDESDILKFVPSSYGTNTRGRYQMYFDGSDVGLSSSDEDVDAIDFDASGNLLVSVDGEFSAQNVKGADEDLFQLSGFTPGANTKGTWSLYFDGSDVGLTSSGEDLFGVWADHANSKLYLTTHDNFSVPGASGDEDDIFVCRYTSLGANTACTFSLFWNGDTFGFDEDAIDGLSIGAPPALISAADSGDSATDGSSSDAVDDTVEYVGDDANEPNPLDGEETTDEAAQNHRILLPLITR